MTATIIVPPDTEGFVPNGWIEPYPHWEGDGPCTGPCCESGYPYPKVWTCDELGCLAKLRQPGTCINCWNISVRR